VIRIDLSREELTRGSGNTALIKLLTKIKFPVDKLPVLKGKGGPNATMVVVVGIAAAAAFLPSLFLSQYKQYVINNHLAQIQVIKDTVAQINADITKLTPYQKELESFEAQKKLVHERLDVIRQLLDQRGAPVNVLDAIGQNLPPRTWLQSLEMTMKGGSPILNIAASSLSNDEISDFVDKLSESVYFSEVTLKDVVGNMVNGIDVKKFGLTARPKSRGLTSTAPATPVNQPAPPNPAARK